MIDSDFDAVNKPMFIDNYDNVKIIILIWSVIIPIMIYMLNMRFKNLLLMNLLINSIIKNGGYINS